MSQLDPAMDIFSPLRHSLLRPNQMAQAMGQPLDIQNPAQRLRAANTLNMARQAGRGAGGQTGTHPQGPQGRSPLTDALVKAKAMVLSGMAQDEIPDDLKSLRDDPNVDLASFQHVAQQYAAKHPQQHNFGGQQTNPNAGTISIAPGSGRDGRTPMSGQQLREGMYAAHKQFSAPGQVQGLGGDDTGVHGYQISGVGPQQQADPVVQMVNAFRGRVPDQMLAAAGAAINSGIPAQQVFNHLNTMASGEQRQEASAQQHQADQQHRDQTAAARQQHSDMQKQLAATQKRLEQEGIDVDGDDGQFVGNDPDTLRLKGEFDKYQAMRKQSQGGGQGGQQGPVQIADKSQVASLPSGTEFVFNGHIYRKK